MELDPAFLQGLEADFQTREVASVALVGELERRAFELMCCFAQQPAAYPYVAGQLVLAGVDERAWLLDLVWRSALWDRRTRYTPAPAPKHRRPAFRQQQELRARRGR